MTYTQVRQKSLLKILDSLLNKFPCQSFFDGNFKTHKKFPSRSPACYRWETSMLTIRSWYRPQKGQGFSTQKKKREIQPWFIRRIVWVDVTVGGKPHGNECSNSSTYFFTCYQKYRRIAMWESVEKGSLSCFVCFSNRGMVWNKKSCHFLFVSHSPKRRDQHTTTFVNPPNLPM